MSTQNRLILRRFKVSLPGFPQPAKPWVITAINIHRVVDGQIQEGWLNWDALGLLQQLGAMPG